MRQATAEDTGTGWKAVLFADGDRAGVAFVAPDEQRSYVEIAMTRSLRQLAFELDAPLSARAHILTFICCELLRRHLNELQIPFWVWCS